MALKKGYVQPFLPNRCSDLSHNPSRRRQSTSRVTSLIRLEGTVRGRGTLTIIGYASNVNIQTVVGLERLLQPENFRVRSHDRAVTGLDGEFLTCE